jgi:hypothetical protein
MRDAPVILITGGRESIDGCVGSTETDHDFKVRLLNSGVFITTAATESSVAVLDIVRRSEDHEGKNCH